MHKNRTNTSLKTTPKYASDKFFKMHSQEMNNFPIHKTVVQIDTTMVQLAYSLENIS